MKKSVIVILVLCLAIGLCACGDEKAVYLNTDQTVSGGTPQKDTNLKNISVSEADGDINVKLSFASGSVTATGSEGAITGLPEYSVSFCENPTRLVVSIKDLTYWDYQQNSTISDPSGLVQGCFKVLPAGSRTHSQVYINLSSGVEFKVNEGNGELIISLRKKDAALQQYFYVVGNLFYEYQDGSLDDEAELTPTLTNDHSAVVMMSRAFQSQSDAEGLKARLEENYSILLANKQLRIFSTDNGGLPSYSDSGVIDELNEKILINRGGVGESANVFFADGRMLCLSNDGTKAIFARKEFSDKYESEKLFVVSGDGSISKLMEYETTSIAFALFSPDDKYLFYVEQIEGTMLGSIYDFSAKKLISIDEEILGTFITGTAWASDSASIYLMAGTELPCLKKYDIASGGISDVLQGNCIETEIYCHGSSIYYNTVIEEEEALVQLDLNTMQTQVLTASDYFSLDSTGKYILTQNPYMSQEGKSVLALYNIEKKQNIIIKEDIILGEYFFSHDSKKVYFVSNDNANEDFAQKVYEYDIDSATLTELFTSINANFSPSWSSDELLMKITYEKNGEFYPATYKIKIK